MVIENKVSKVNGKVPKPEVKNNVVLNNKQMKTSLNFRQTAVIKESTGTSIFGISVNEKLRKGKEPLVLAAVGGKFIWFYELLNSTSTSGNNLKFIDAFEDKDDEDFYCCDWSYYVPLQNRSKSYLDGNMNDCLGGQQVVACAGSKGIIRIVSPNMAQSIIHLEGHGEAINELKFHPRASDLLFSFSRDYTIRLWNFWTEVLVCVFGGCEGHRSEILHGDVDMTGVWLLSCGMDHTMKIWRISGDSNDHIDKKHDRITDAIKLSRKWNNAENKTVFPTDFQHFPVFSSNKIHKNYIDCGRWFGRMILSKSCDGYMSLWKPGTLDSELEFQFKIGQEAKESILHQFELIGSEIWYIRFDLHAEKGLVAWGNRQGEIYIWNLREGQHSENSVFDIEPTMLGVSLGSRGGDGTGAGSAASSNLVVRQTRFANDGRTLLCACDQGIIVRFDTV